MKRFDHFVSGLFAGLFLPPVAFYIFAYYSFNNADPMLVFKSYYHRHLLTHVISLSVLINLIIFFIFINADSYRAAKGIIGATLIYFMIVLILKFT